MTKEEAYSLAEKSASFIYNPNATTNELLSYIYEWVRYYARNGKYHMTIEIPYICERASIVEDILKNGYVIHPVNNSKYISLSWGGGV